MRAIVAQAAKATKAAFSACSKPAPYGLNSVLDALIAVRDALNSIGSALRPNLSWWPRALPAITSAGWR